MNDPEGEKGEDALGHQSIALLVSPLLPPASHRSIRLLPPLLPSLAVLHLLVMVALPAALALVQHFDRLHQVALEGGECSADGRGPETVGEETEVGEASLDARLQAEGWPAASQRRAVLGHEVHKLLTDLPEKKEDVLGSGTFRCRGSIPADSSLTPILRCKSHFKLLNHEKPN